MITAKRTITRHLGISLVEVMLALSISGLLLSGLATSMTAVADSWTANDQYLRSVQAARLATLRINAEIRKSLYCQVGETTPTGGVRQVSDTTVLKFRPTATALSSFRLRNGQLLLCQSDIGPTSDGTVLARNVSDVQFIGQVDPANSQIYNVQVQFTINNGKLPVKVVTSAVPRQALDLQ